MNALSKLLGPHEVRELAERLGVSPTKKLGQNFVIDPNTVRKIVRLAGVEAGDRVIEVGPGLGSLTLGLTEAGADVTAVEIDARLAEELPRTVRTMQPQVASESPVDMESAVAMPQAPSNSILTADPISTDGAARLRVIHSDALELTRDALVATPRFAPRAVTEASPAEPSNASRSLGSSASSTGEDSVTEAADMPEVLVANLPYNVSVPILMHLLELIPSLRAGLVMVQAEVGHRIAAAPGSKEYGSPSAKASWYGEWSIAGTVSRRIFWPVPGVDSVLVSYARRETPRGSEAERVGTFELVNAAFAQRRKMLRQSLQPVLGGTAQTVAVLESAGVDPTHRAEQLGIEEFLAIARVV